MTASISVLLMGLFIFSVSSWFSLERLYDSKHLSISSRLSNVLAYNFHNTPLYFYDVDCYLLSSISDFIYQGLLSFLTKFWSIYIYLSMHTLLLLYDLVFKVVKHKIIKQKMSLASFKLSSSAFSLKLSYVGTSQFVCFPYFLLWHSHGSWWRILEYKSWRLIV